MKAIILAAGRGSRMKKMTAHQPKCLTMLKGRPLIEWQLHALREAGINDISVVTGYRSNTLRQYNLTEFHNKNWSQTNMLSSLACAEDWLRENDCIVTYGDIFYEYSALLSLKQVTANIAITYDKNWKKLWFKRFENPLLDAETFKLNENSSVTEIGKRPKSFKDIQGQFMGLLKFTPKGWSTIQELRKELFPTERDQIDMTSALNKIIDSKKIEIIGVKYEKSWGEVDTESDLSIYEDYNCEHK